MTKAPNDIGDSSLDKPIALAFTIFIFLKCKTVNGPKAFKNTAEIFFGNVKMNVTNIEAMKGYTIGVAIGMALAFCSETVLVSLCA